MSEQFLLAVKLSSGKVDDDLREPEPYLVTTTEVIEVTMKGIIEMLLVRDTSQSVRIRVFVGNESVNSMLSSKILSGKDNFSVHYTSVSLLDPYDDTYFNRDDMEWREAEIGIKAARETARSLADDSPETLKRFWNALVSLYDHAIPLRQGGLKEISQGLKILFSDGSLEHIDIATVLILQTFISTRHETGFYLVSHALSCRAASRDLDPEKREMFHATIKWQYQKIFHANRLSQKLHVQTLEDPKAPKGSKEWALYFSDDKESEELRFTVNFTETRDHGGSTSCRVTDGEEQSTKAVKTHLEALSVMPRGTSALVSAEVDTGNHKFYKNM